MSHYTYTLVVKADSSILDGWEHPHGSTLTRFVLGKLGADRSEANVVVARESNGEALILVHVPEDSSRFGIKLANWLGEMPFEAPYPVGSLLWYR